MIDKIKKLQVFQIEVFYILYLLLLLVLYIEFKGIYSLPKPRMRDRLLILLLILFLRKRNGDDMWVFYIEDCLKSDEAVRVFGLKAQQIKEGHCGI